MESFEKSYEENTIEAPDEFSFPFTPYDIQKDFMKALFSALEGRKLGIFESPTGTGKSLSLLCGSLTWLESREEERLRQLKNIVSEFDVLKEEEVAKECVDWITAQYNLRKKKDVVNKARRELKFMEDLMEKRRKILQKRKTVKHSMQYHVKSSVTKNKNINTSEEIKQDEEDLEDLIINDEFAPDVHSDSDYSEEEDQEPEFHSIKIIFASRTHTQLSQFANELKRTPFATTVTATSLGSRQNLCINPEVTRLKSLSLMNERCLDLQKGSKGKKTSETKKMKGCGGCPFFKHTAIEELKTHILSEPMDIEDLVQVAKTDFQACPYYATRKASKEAQLILLPYNTVLHKGTREGVRLNVQNSVVLLDEAHNIIESISNMYSTYVNLSQLEDCSSGLKVYMSRYMRRFNAKNLLLLKQISFVLKSLVQFMSKADAIQRIFTIQEFKVEVGIENLDLYELLKFMKKSKLVFKLKGYLQQRHKIEEKTAEMNTLTGKKSDSKYLNKDIKLGKPDKKSQNKTKSENNKQSSAGQGILNFAEFFKSLLTFDAEGRIITDGTTLKFLLLNTADHFSELITSARSIILTGGTMKPWEEIEDQLFLSARHRIAHFSCDHVIPDKNLICISLSKGPSSTLFDFTFKNRNSPNLMEELSRTITNVAKIVPGGLVCFLPSYEYENALYNYLKQSGGLEKIEIRKKIFREPKDSSCDTLLTDYSRQIRNNSSGAVLFAVVGGKLSEGINFCDDLGRCVIVVGLPFPNITSTEIKEKVRFVTERFGKEKGANLLPNMCSKAVNQSIGRAIRHSQDYAAIILIDRRYANPNQHALLPNWIRKKFLACDHFGQAVGSLAKFFSEKKNNREELP